MNIILCFLPKINYRYYKNTSAYLTKYFRWNEKVCYIITYIVYVTKCMTYEPF